MDSYADMSSVRAWQPLYPGFDPNEQGKGGPKHFLSDGPKRTQSAPAIQHISFTTAIAILGFFKFLWVKTQFHFRKSWNVHIVDQAQSIHWGKWRRNRSSCSDCRSRNEKLKFWGDFRLQPSIYVFHRSQAHQINSVPWSLREAHLKTEN